MPASAALGDAAFLLRLLAEHHLNVWCDRNIRSFTQDGVTAGHSAGRGGRQAQSVAQGTHVAWKCHVFVGSSCPATVRHPTCHPSRGGSCCVSVWCKWTRSTLETSALCVTDTDTERVSTWSSHHTRPSLGKVD